LQKNNTHNSGIADFGGESVLIGERQSLLANADGGAVQYIKIHW
jgi:hypothetical protein